MDKRDFGTCSRDSLLCSLFVSMRLCGSAQTQSRETQRGPEAVFSAPSWTNFVFTDMTSCSVGRRGASGQWCSGLLGARKLHRLSASESLAGAKRINLFGFKFGRVAAKVHESDVS